MITWVITCLALTLFMYFLRVNTLPVETLPNSLKVRVFIMNGILGLMTFGVGACFL